MGVSENSDTPNPSIFIGFSIINHPLFLETPISWWIFCKPLNSTHGKLLSPNKNSLGQWIKKQNPIDLKKLRRNQLQMWWAVPKFVRCVKNLVGILSLASRGWNQVKDTNRPIKNCVFLFFFRGVFSFLGSNIRCFLNKSKWRCDMI